MPLLQAQRHERLAFELAICVVSAAADRQRHRRVKRVELHEIRHHAAIVAHKMWLVSHSRPRSTIPIRAILAALRVDLNAARAGALLCAGVAPPRREPECPPTHSLLGRLRLAGAGPKYPAPLQGRRAGLAGVQERSNRQKDFW